MLNDILSLIGSILLGACALPETIKALVDKKSHNSWMFLIMWFVGDLCLLWYGLNVGLPIAIVLNNAFNALCIVVIAWFK